MNKASGFISEGVYHMGLYRTILTFMNQIFSRSHYSNVNMLRFNPFSEAGNEENSSEQLRFKACDTK